MWFFFHARGGPWVKKWWGGNFSQIMLILLFKILLVRKIGLGYNVF